MCQKQTRWNKTFIFQVCSVVQQTVIHQQSASGLASTNKTMLITEECTWSWLDSVVGSFLTEHCLVAWWVMIMNNGSPCLLNWNKTLWHHQHSILSCFLHPRLKNIFNQYGSLLFPLKCLVFLSSLPLFVQLPLALVACFCFLFFRTSVTALENWVQTCDWFCLPRWRPPWFCLFLF